MWKFYLFKNKDKINPIKIPVEQGKYFKVIKEYLMSVDVSSLPDQERGNYIKYLESNQITKKNIPFLLSVTCSNNRELLNKLIELYNSTRKRNKLNPEEFDFASLMCSKTNAKDYNFLRFVTPEIRKQEAYGIKEDKKEDKLIPLIYKEDLHIYDTDTSYLDFDSLFYAPAASNNISYRLDNDMNDIRHNKHFGYEYDKDKETMWNALLEMYFPKYQKLYDNCNYRGKVNDDNFVPDSITNCFELKELMHNNANIVDMSENKSVPLFYHLGFVLTYVELRRLNIVSKKLGRNFDFDINKLNMEERAFAAIYSQDELYNHIIRYPKGKYTITDYKKQANETPIEQLIAEKERKEQEELNKINSSQESSFTIDDIINTNLDDLFNISNPKKSEIIPEEKVNDFSDENNEFSTKTVKDPTIYQEENFVGLINMYNEKFNTNYTLDDYMIDDAIRREVDIEAGIYNFDDEERGESR